MNHLYLEIFTYGFAFCMISDIFFSISNFFIQKAYYYRNLRKNKGGLKDG